MNEQTKSLLRTIAYLFGVVTGAGIAVLALLILSIFIDIGLPTAFAIQAVAAFLGGAVASWKTA